MARSPFVPMEERSPAPEQGAGAAKGQAVEQEEVLLVHSQVRRIKQEDEEARARLLKLQRLETMPAAGGLIRELAARQASRSLSPLRRAGNAIPAGH
ncbi:hypothetical protein ACP70R_045059 [Stipagrostis hirtigluma subsp. patula]